MDMFNNLLPSDTQGAYRPKPRHMKHQNAMAPLVENHLDEVSQDHRPQKQKSQAENAPAGGVSKGIMKQQRSARYMGKTMGKAN